MIRIFKYVKKINILYLLIAIALIVLQVYFELKIPDYTQKLMQAISSEQIIPGSLKMKDILVNGGLMLLCALGTMIAMIIGSFITSRLAAETSYTLRNAVMTKVTSFSNAEVNKFTTPSLITRTTNDIVQVQNFVGMGIQLLFKAPIMALWAMLKISNTSLDWTFATLCFVVAIVGVVITLVIVVLPKFKKIQKLTDDLNDVTRENVSGVRVVRAFNAEKYQNTKFEKVNNEITKTQLFTSRALSVMTPVMTLCMSALTVVIYWMGAGLINNADMASKSEVLGNMGAFTQLAMNVIMSFILLVMIFIILPRTSVSAKRINEVLDTEPSIKDGKSLTKADNNGTVEFKNVSFSYSNNLEHATLTNINFKANKGETIAIIGSTGAGKTTLVNLINRFYDVTEGEVLVNGKNVKDYQLTELNKHISIATQKAVLFSGDIKKNITYGDTFVQERFNKAVEVAQANFINELEEKENSSVSQNGTNFSGGQKQRISIARCLYKEADIFIFDDTFSALDYRTDMMVRKAINEKYSDKTIFIVAQRIGTIRQADQIIVLDNGQIVGIGKHEDLLETCEVYKDIALSQLSEDELNNKEVIE